MSGTTWTKFFWSDWESDPALRHCSLAAQGLWMRMLCIAAAHDPIGYVAVAGRGLDETSLARMTGCQESEAAILLGELERNGVFSRDRHGRIYNRRMIEDAKKAAIARKNGKNGGNPSLRKDNAISASDKGRDKGRDKPQEPRASIQTIEPPAQQTLPPREPMTFDKLCDAASFDPNRLPHPGLLKIGPIIDLIAKGYSLETDVLPVIRDLAAARVSFNSWSYVVPIVIERTAKRNAIPAKQPTPDVDWQARVNAWREDPGNWIHAWGPKPDEPRCKAPPELLRTAA